MNLGALIPAHPPETEKPSRAFLGVERSLTGRHRTGRLDAESAAIATAIAQRDQIPEIVARVLAARGVGVDARAAHLTTASHRPLQARF